MNRFHVHVSVSNLAESIRFSSTLFAAAPVRVEADYAKWMLDNPRLTFAISSRRDPIGVDHLGFQVDTGDELVALKSQLSAADVGLVEQTATPCCYVTSDKYWVTDPAGVGWQTFHTLVSIPVYRDDRKVSATPSCCEPVKPTADGPGCLSNAVSESPRTCCS